MDAEAAADAAVAAAEANVVAAVVIAVAPVAAVVIAVAPVAAVVIAVAPVAAAVVTAVAPVGGCVNILYLSVYTYKEVRMLKRNFIHFQQGGAASRNFK